MTRIPRGLFQKKTSAIDRVRLLFVGHELVRAWPLDHSKRFKGVPHSAVDVPRAQEFTQSPGFDGAAARFGVG